MFSRFFIEHPIFATVVALMIVIAGIVSMVLLPIEQYPTITPVQVTVSATYPGRRLADRGRIRGGAHRGTDQRRRQHALHDIHELLQRPAAADGLLHPQHRPGYRAGTGAEPGQPRRAAAARGGDAAGRLGAEKVVLHHDADRHLRQGGALQRDYIANFANV